MIAFYIFIGFILCSILYAVCFLYLHKKNYRIIQKSDAIKLWELGDAYGDPVSFNNAAEAFEKEWSKL
ncbi:MAG: hypothetical protein ACK53T_07965 [Planctomycetota bacterium]|jgi:hypothetical protein